jgi:hypothetical protein
MSQAANTLNGDQVPCSCSGIAQGVEDGDASTKQRRGFVSWQIVRHSGNGLCGDNDVFGVASIEVDRRNLFELAENKVAPPAWVALKAMSTVPTNADTLTGLP